MDPQAELDLLEAGEDDCQTPRRQSDQACLQLEPSNINHAKKSTGNRENQPIYGKTTSTSTYNHTDPTETTTISRATSLGSLRRKTARKWDAMESDFIGSRLKPPARTTTPINHQRLTKTTQAHGQHKNDTEEDDEQDDDDTLLILS